jgi:sugar phosphate isomerase/epimerase
MGSLKISCALWSLSYGRTEEKLLKALENAVTIGVKAVQPWCVDVIPWNLETVLDPGRCMGGSRREWVRRIHGFGLEISGLCAQLMGEDRLGNFAPGDDLDGRILKTCEALRLAADMDVPVVTTHIGRIPEDRNDPLYRQYFEATRTVAQSAEENGVFFGIETGQESAEVLGRFIEDVGSNAVKVNYDPANMLRYDPVKGVTLLKDYIVHTHAKDRDPETKSPTVGKGAVPWKAYIDALKGIGYEGWYALEDESGQDVFNSLKTGREFLTQF